jgi:hypothetical protein
VLLYRHQEEKTAAAAAENEFLALQDIQTRRCVVAVVVAADIFVQQKEVFTQIAHI